MRISTVLGAVASAVFALGALAQPATPQSEGAPGGEGTSSPSLFLVDRETRVRSVGFRFETGSAIETKRLRTNIAYSGPGALVGLRGALDFLPGVSAPELRLFSPLTLQKDVARLRRLYRQEGFPDVEVDYEVALDTAANEVHVDFLIDQGAPLALGAVDVLIRADTAAASRARSQDGSAATSLPLELRRDWERHLDDLTSFGGNRYGAQQRARLRNQTSDWFLDRGYPWVDVDMEAADTTERVVDVELVVRPGPRARVDEIVVEGNARLSRHVVTREIPFDTGDWYGAHDVAAAEAELYELDLVQRALGDVPEGQSRDSTVSVRFRVNEGRPRLVWGRVGWRSEAGVTGEAHWSHRDFFGGARTLTVSATGDTGWGGIEAARGRNVGLSALVRQPYVLHRSLSATTGPFIRFRDDFRDRSLLYGVETALIYRAGALQSVTLQHELSRLRVDDAFDLVPIRELVQQGERPFEPVFIKSVFKLVGTFGTLDNRLDPRSGFLLEPNLEVTGPTSVSDVEFFRAALEAAAAVPLTDQTGLFLRGSAGRLFPFGESDPTRTTDDTRAIVGLRGVLFTAGGTADVRGWGRGLLGPKMPEVSVDGSGNVTSDRFLPVGGLARLTGSVELRLPFPLLPEEHSTHVFLDGGRVWSPGGEFDAADPELSTERWAYGVGGGMQIATLVGPVRLSVGYKLNPTAVDLLSPGQVARALASGEDLSDLSTGALKRWHLHLSIGRGL